MTETYTRQCLESVHRKCPLLDCGCLCHRDDDYD